MTPDEAFKWICLAFFTAGNIMALVMFWRSFSMASK